MIPMQACQPNILKKYFSTLGPNEFCFLSQDDKARVPIGLLQPTNIPFADVGHIQSELTSSCMIG